MSFVALERSVLVGALAIQPWDGVRDQPVAGRSRVTLLRNADRKLVQKGDPHPSGVFGFLTLQPGNYLALIEPISPGVLPSLRRVTVPLSGGDKNPLRPILRPAPTYPVPRHFVALRGTAYWSAANPRPVRWAAVTGSLSGVAGTSWTRTDGRGEFLLCLPTPPPAADGTVAATNASVSFFAAAPTGKALDADDLSDLPVDDKTDVNNFAPLPAKRILTVPVLADDDLSLNQMADTFQSVDPRTGAKLSNRVIFLGP